MPTSKLLFFSVFLSISIISFAATRTWIGACGTPQTTVGTNIADPLNWSGQTALLPTDDYTMVLNNFGNGSYTLNLTQSTDLTFNSFAIRFVGTGNGSSKQKLAILTSSNNLTVTNTLTIANTGSDGNINHRFELRRTGGTLTCGSFSFLGDGLQQANFPLFLNVEISSGAVFNCTGSFTMVTSTTSGTYCNVSNAGTINISGTASFSNTALPASNKIQGIIRLNANDGGRFNFYGNVTVPNTSGYITTFQSDSTGQSTGKFYFYANVNMGAFGWNWQNGNNAGEYIFDAPVSQTLTTDTPAIRFSNVKIGEANSPILTLAGRSRPRVGNKGFPRNMSINNSAVLNIPSGYSFNRDTTGGLTGDLSIPGLGTLICSGDSLGQLGNNHPGNFLTYSYDSLSTVIYNGTMNQSISGDSNRVLKFGNLTLTNATKTLRGSINVFRKFKISPNTTFSLAALSATLKSNAVTTAWVDTIPTTATITYGGIGRFVVERYISRLRKWQLLSIPTDSSQTVRNAWQEGAASKALDPVPGYGMQVTNFTGTTCVGCDTTSPGGHSVKYYNAATNNYTGITSTTSHLIGSQQGYFAFTRGDRLSLSSPATTTNATVLRTKGMLYTGTRTPVAVIDTFFALVGNPYAAPVFMKSMTMTGIAGTSTDKGTIYVWDPTIGGLFGLGAYKTFTYNSTSLNYEPTPATGLYTGANRARLESGQAFFVKGRTLGGSNSVTFMENVKDSGSVSVSFAPPTYDMSRKLRVNLFAVQNSIPNLVDGSLIYFNNAFANGADDMDAMKMSNTGENFSILSAGRKLVVDYRSLPGNGDIINLNIQNTSIQNYQLEIDAANLQANGRSAYLEDKYLQRTVGMDLNGIITYGFRIENIPGAYAADRFRIIFKQEIFPVAVTDISAERNTDNSVTVKWNVENEINVASLEVESTEDKINFTKQGNVAPQNNNGIAAYSFADSKASLNALYYRIKSTETNGNVKYSGIAKVAAVTDVKSTYTIFPNPVTEGKLNISFINKLPGTYSLTISDSKGQTIKTEKLNITDLHSLKLVSLNREMAAGSYRVTIISPYGAQSTVSFLIQ